MQCLRFRQEWLESCGLSEVCGISHYSLSLWLIIRFSLRKKTCFKVIEHFRLKFSHVKTWIRPHIVSITFAHSFRNFHLSKKNQIRFDFLRFCIRSKHFDRRGWRIWKNAYGNIRVQWPSFIKDALNWLNVTLKTFTMLQRLSTSNKCCSFELSVHLWILKNIVYHSLHKNIDQHNCFQHW